MTSQGSQASGSGPETSQTSLETSNQTLSQSQPTESSQNDGRVSSTNLSGSDRIYPARSLVPNPSRRSHALPVPSPTITEELEEPSYQPANSTNDNHSQPGATVPSIAHDIHAPSHNSLSVSINDEISSNTPATGDLEHVAESVVSDTTTQRDIDANEPLMTDRMEHVFTDEGHYVSTGNGKTTIERCEDEPIRTPGAIQSFGAMVALREESPNQFVVRTVSENSELILGFSPQQLFATESFTDLLNENQRNVFLEHLDYARDDSYDLIIDGPEVFLLTIRQPSGDDIRFWCAAHVNQENKDIVICEFELENDRLNPLNVEDRNPPDTPISTLQTNPPPTEAQYAESTVSASNSVRSIRDARFKKGEAAAMQVFGVLSQIQAQLSHVDDEETLLKVTAGLVKELVGFHRVMVYKFDENANGKVVAELMDPSITVDLYQGLHFPASDIPAQARELYKINKVRLLYDRDHITARLVCRTLDDLGTPLDMSHAYLRAMSPIHNQYLANMKVRSSMSISINAYDNLWGLISCHWYGDEGMRVPFPIRKLCRLVGDTVARNIERISRTSNLQARAMMNSVPKEADPSKYIVGTSEDLLHLFHADHGVLSIGNETKLFGGERNTQEVLALVEYIRQREVTSIVSSHDIQKDFPDFNYQPGQNRISGLLYLPINSNGRDFIMFLRLGELKRIKWAGNPYKPAGGGIGPLTPRQSFKEWREITLSRSKEWSQYDITTAGILGSVYGKFVQVWRQKNILKKESQLTRLLLANSAHELRTPLNAVINYLEIAMEGSLDEETRENLIRSYSASKSLVYIINDLLDLATEQGQQLIRNEPLMLEPTLRDAFEFLAVEARRKGISCVFKMTPGVPDEVLCDERRLRQLFVSLATNAIENTSKGGVTVQISPCGSSGDSTLVAISIVDSGSGMSRSKQERLFKELEEVYADQHWVKEGDDNNYQNQKHHVIGTGLALTARIVHIMQGQLIFKSEEGKGSRFKVIFPFQIPGLENSSSPQEDDVSALAEGPNSPPILDGELTLVENDKEDTPEPSRHLIDDPLDDTETRSIGSVRRPKDSRGRASGEHQKKELPLRPSRQIPDRSPEPSHVQQGQSEAPEGIPQDDSQNLTPNPEAPTPGPPDVPQLTILIAEDNPVNRKILEKRLTKTGHNVHFANNGETCVEAFSSQNETFDAILMDIQVSLNSPKYLCCPVLISSRCPSSMESQPRKPSARLNPQPLMSPIHQIEFLYLPFPHLPSSARRHLTSNPVSMGGSRNQLILQG